MLESSARSSATSQLSVRRLTVLVLLCASAAAGWLLLSAGLSSAHAETSTQPSYQELVAQNKKLEHQLNVASRKVGGKGSLATRLHALDRTLEGGSGSLHAQAKAVTRTSRARADQVKDLRSVNRLLKSDLRTSDARVRTLTVEKGDRDARLEAAERAVADLSATVAARDVTIDDQATHIGTLASEKAQLEQLTSSLQDDKDALSGQVATLRDTVATLTTDNKTLTTDNKTLTDQAAALTTTVSTSLAVINGIPGITTSDDLYTATGNARTLVATRNTTIGNLNDQVGSLDTTIRNNLNTANYLIRVLKGTQKSDLSSAMDELRRLLSA